MSIEETKLHNVYALRNEPGLYYATKNLIPGFSVYGEKLIESKAGELRAWDQRKSKLASGMVRGINMRELQEGLDILYLGASSGTTVSHLSDIVGNSGKIFAIEFAPRPMRDLVILAYQRENIIPILADARQPSQYSHLVNGVDFLYCDVAQPNQAELFLENAKAFLKPGGIGYIAIKARSISQKEKIDVIFQKQVDLLEKGGFKRLKLVDISRFHRQHKVFFGKWN